MIGRTLSHFRIVDQIGEGGMGVVYSAEDERLRRPVALKVLRPELMPNEERRLRFMREARAAAAVSHPNIATIYEVGEEGGVVFIAMECVQGKTLRELVAGRPMAIGEALRVATEIADGLAQAHHMHVIHRDLKPENVMVGADGRARILDFGLAKLLEARDAMADLPPSQVATISAEITRQERLLGTPTYMSPEQARGAAADVRSDLFAFGSILYEMVTGRPPFRGKSTTDTLSAIVRDEPIPPLQLNRHVPQELERIIRKCLEKDPGDRYQHADDLAVDLRCLKRAPAPSAERIVGTMPSRNLPGGPRLARLRERIAWTVVASLLAVVGLLSYALIAGRPAVNPPPPVIRIAAGPLLGREEGGYGAMGRGLAELLTHKLPALEFRAIVTDASVENVLLVEGDEAELGFTQNDVAFHAVNTERVLGYRSTKIVALAVLFEEVAQILVNKAAAIHTIHDFKGKPVGIGPPKSGSRFSSTILLWYFGIGPGDFQANQDEHLESVRQVRDGTLAAAITWLFLPTPNISNALLGGRVELLGIDHDDLRGLMVSHPFYRPVTIPARTYPNQEKDIPSIGVKSMLIASRSMDDEVVQAILETIFDSIPDLTSYHPRAADVSLKTAYRFEDGLTINLHPAAERFFRSRDRSR
jgi:TRAP transporter TAXI family solute receptor